MSPLFSWVAKVPEIISSIRQAGKIARQEELHCPSEFDDTFSKKFEVLFCGRVTVAHKKAPPALIDECIEKFNHVSCSLGSESPRPAPPPAAPTGSQEPGRRPMRKSFSQPGLRSLAFRKELQDGGSEAAASSALSRRATLRTTSLADTILCSPQISRKIELCSSRLASLKFTSSVLTPKK